MFSKLVFLFLGLAWCQDEAVMTTDMTPDEGPETGSVYVLVQLVGTGLRKRLRVQGVGYRR